MPLPDTALLLAAGLVGGMLNSLAGGGSLIVFPAYLAVGYSALAANVTNSVAQWPSYLGGVIGFRRHLDGQRARAVRYTVVGMAGAVAGSLVLLALPSRSFDLVVPFLVLAASLLLAVQPRLGRRIRSRAHGFGRGRAVYPVLFLSGGYGGYFGGALGVILVGVLSLTVPEGLHRINALKTVLSTTVGAVTVVVFGLAGPVNWAGAGVVAPATLAGGLLGARLARQLDERVLRAGVVAFGVGVSVYLFLRR